jgi:hypothetical protein
MISNFRQVRLKNLWQWTILAIGVCALLVCWIVDVSAATPVSTDAVVFPPSLESYDDSQMKGILTILVHRVQQEPFNLVATLIFIFAIVHTFLTGKFMGISHRWEHMHEMKIKNGKADRDSVHHGAELFHFLGEVEAVFGIWAGGLLLAVVLFHDWSTAVNYITHQVNFTEAMFVVVIMTLAATRPILQLADGMIQKVAGLLGGTLTAYWFTILTIGPLLGSFITEPAAMTLTALVLGKNFYALKPSQKFKYATLGLLFVNISVGGTLTHFAAPPVLMVAGPWEWSTLHMLSHFGWKAILGILLSNSLYWLIFRKEIQKLEGKFALVSLKEKIQNTYMRRSVMDAMFDGIIQEISQELGARSNVNLEIDKVEKATRERLEQKFLPQLIQQGYEPKLVEKAFNERFEEIMLRQMRRGLPGFLPPEKKGFFIDPDWDNRDDPVPVWVTLVHVGFMAWTIVNAHYPQLFIPGILFFLGFAQVTNPYQNRIDLKPPLLVGFFLGGLVVHGGLQGWWIAPILGSLAETPLMIGATLLTAFNDNAAITFLSTLVPGLTDSLKYAVVAGAVAGGGLTIIANAPNPAGVSLLKKYFNNEVSPPGILGGALIPTIIMIILFLIL